MRHGPPLWAPCEGPPKSCAAFEGAATPPSGTSRTGVDGKSVNTELPSGALESSMHNAQKGADESTANFEPSPPPPHAASDSTKGTEPAHVHLLSAFDTRVSWRAA